MANDKLAQNVLALQRELVRRLGQHGKNVVAPPTPQLLRRIQSADASLLQYALGEFGSNLARYAQSLDIGHPDIVGILDGMLCDNQKFSQYCLELLKLAEYAHADQMTHVFPDLGQIMVRELVSKSIAKKIDGSIQLRSHVRLVADPDHRHEIRLSKRIQNIDLTGVYKKGEEVWQSQPDNFKKFMRFDSAYEEEIKSAERKMKRYLELRCTSLANEIAKALESFKENMEQSYYGFNRITMTNAAIILAKSLNYFYTVIHGIPSIRVSHSFFKGYNFETSVSTNVMAIFDSLDSYVYQPRVYPYHELQDIAPADVKSTIGLLENFPEANNRPIFDHYGVIVPSIAFVQEGFYNESGFYLQYDNVEAARKALDKVFISGKYFYPIVVGEKDGKCYFICYWA